LLVERLAAAHGIEIRQQRHGARVGDGRLFSRRCLFVLPQSFMNRSGDTVRRVLGFAGLEPADLLVVHDDMDLPLGRLRLRRGGGAGGHRGVASIIEQIGSPDFVRLKIGVGRPPAGVPAEGYVLQRFAPGERPLLHEAISRGVEATEIFLTRGLDAAMNACNAASSTGENAD